MRSLNLVSSVTGMTGSHRLDLSLATGFFSRLRGLMLAPILGHGAGLLLMHCTSIHTCFMRQAIDVLYVDEAGVVVKCVPALAAWRISFGNDVASGRNGRARACHVVELRAGSIERLGIAPGCRIDHPLLRRTTSHAGGRLSRQRGSAMIEFAIVAPVMTLIGLATIQYGLLFFARNQYNHAAFMAARAGSTGHADLETIRTAYSRALVPLYGGGLSADDLAKSYVTASTEVADKAVIDMLNPTAESFADWNDVDLQQSEGGGQRVIPNGGLAMKKAAIVPAASGQSIQDANLLKLRITHGYKPQVPVIGMMYTRYLKWLDPGTSKTNTELIKRDLIPVVMHVTMHMQSDAIEGTTVSTPGVGNGGAPSDPGTPPRVNGEPPSCATALCIGAAQGGGSGGPGTGGTGTGGTGGDGDGGGGGGGNRANGGDSTGPGTGGGTGSGSGEPGQGGAGGDGSQPGGICLIPAALGGPGP